MNFFTALLMGWALSAPLLAIELAPDLLVKNLTNEVLEIVRKDSDIQSGNTKKAIALVEEKVLPSFNFARMTQLAMARDWKKASAAQQKTLIDEFRTILVRTYSKALTEYKSQTIEFKPLAKSAGETDVKVRTAIAQTGGGKAIELDYSLEKVGPSWKVYDIEVSGVSLVTNYRDQFAAEVRNSGVDGLIKTLQSKNMTSKTSSVAK